jgi:hypothetical protein
MQHLQDAALCAALEVFGGAAMPRIFPLKSLPAKIWGLVFLTSFSFFLFLLPPNVHGLDAILAWDVNSEEGIAGYRIFTRKEGDGFDYTAPAWQGTATTCTISSLVENTTYYFVARTYDVFGNESPDSEEVFYESSQNTPPTAITGSEQTVNETSTVTLNGSNSYDSDGMVATYLWTQTEGSTVALSNSTASLSTFTAPHVGVGGEKLTFKLLVTDNGGLTDTESVVVNVVNVNQMPVSLAGGDQMVDESTIVTLDGSNSYDPGGAISSYHWTQKSGYSVTLSSDVVVQPSFTAPPVGNGGQTLTFDLTVTDDSGASDTDSVSIYIAYINQKPSADAGEEQTVYEGDTVTLDGTNSSDPDGAISFHWTQIAGPDIILSDSSTSTPSFAAPEVEADGTTLIFQVTITDSDGLSSKAVCNVHVLWADDNPSLVSLSINGSSTVNESTTSIFTATATFSDGTTKTVTENANWIENSAYANFDRHGVLSTSEVTGEAPLIITASYSHENVMETGQKSVTILEVPESNLSPSKPVITSPYDGQMDSDLQTYVITEAFSDPDGDNHRESQWQIAKSDSFDLPILDTSSTEQLIELTAPHMLLEAETTYHVRVRFYDVYSMPSAWSDAIEFTTVPSNNDLDGNGVPDDQEVDFGVDVDGNGVDDIEEPEKIKSVMSNDGDIQMGITKAEESEGAIEDIQAVRVIDPSTISDNDNRPASLSFGLLAYRLRVRSGSTAKVKIYFSRRVPTRHRYFMYDTISGWYNYSEHVTFNDDRTSIIVSIKDGGYGDSDGIENGIIVDPGGFGLPISSGGGGGGSSNVFSHIANPVEEGCFIKSAGFEPNAERDRTMHMTTLRVIVVTLVGVCNILTNMFGTTGTVAVLLLTGIVLTCLLRMHGRTCSENHEARIP